MFKSEELNSKLSEIGEQAMKAVLALMSSHKATSLNVGEYYRECEITNYTFFDTDRHDFAMAMSLEGIDCTSGIDLTFVDENSGETIEKSWDETYSDEEKVYILAMVEEIFDLIDNPDEEEPLPIVPMGKTFEDMEE